MQKFFVPDIEKDAREIVISGDDARHISRSLRMAPGDEVVVCNGAGLDMFCRITGFSKDSVTLEVTSSAASEAEPTYRATLYQSLAKSDKMETIIQKAVEAGVYRIVPVESRFCIAKKGDNTENKLNRWRRIALEAAKQCGRGIIPQVDGIKDFKTAVEEASSLKCPFICYEDEGDSVFGDKVLPGEGEYGFFVGPEGGYSKDEIEFAVTRGIKSVGLGKRILRCETASLFVLACLSFMNALAGGK